MYLSSKGLSDHTLGDFVGVAVLLESESFDMGVGGDSLGLGGGSDLFNLG